jgi:type I restriction enzyme S subunit
MSLVRLKDFLSRNNGGTWGELSDDGIVALRSTEQTVDGKWKIKSPAIISSIDADLDCILKEGDLLLTKSSGSKDHIGKTTLVNEDIANLNAVYSNFMQRIRVNKKSHPEFIYLFLNSENVKDQYKYNFTDTVGLGNLNASMINNLKIKNFTLDDQKEISAKANIELGKLDRVLKILKQKLHHLDEYKTALIHNAVTKGLDAKGCRILDGTPAAEIKWKDSGVEWIGEVPDGWDVSKLKSHVVYETGATPSTGDTVAYDGAVPWACISDLGSNCDLVDTSKHITHESAIAKNMMLAPVGSLLYSFKLSVGKTSCVKNPCYFNEAIACFKEFVDIEKMFLSYILMSYFDECGFENIYGARLLNRGVIENGPVAITSLNEQHVISAYLDEQLSLINTIKESTKTKIGLLVKYKKSMVNEAVSGSV